MTTDPGETPPQNADEALARLQAGNLRFVSGEARFPTVQKEVLAELTRGQQPHATIPGAATAGCRRNWFLMADSASCSS